MKGETPTTIKTLMYIYNLLVEQEQETNEVYREARDLERKYEENDAAKDLVKEARGVADKMMKAHIEAIGALDEFREKSWE